MSVVVGGASKELKCFSQIYLFMFSFIIIIIVVIVLIYHNCKNFFFFFLKNFFLATSLILNFPHWGMNKVFFYSILYIITNK